MKVKISWQFGGDSIYVTTLDGETIAAANGGRAKSAIFEALKAAGVRPDGRRLNDDMGTPNNPAPLGVERFWDFEAEISEETVKALREAQVQVDAEAEAIHQEALELLRQKGIDMPLFGDAVIAEAVKGHLLPFLSVNEYNTGPGVFLSIPPGAFSIEDPPGGRGMALKVTCPDGHTFYTFEDSALCATLLGHLIYVVDLCYTRPRRAK